MDFRRIQVKLLNFLIYLKVDSLVGRENLPMDKGEFNIEINMKGIVEQGFWESMSSIYRACIIAALSFL